MSNQPLPRTFDEYTSNLEIDTDPENGTLGHSDAEYDRDSNVDYNDENGPPTLVKTTPVKPPGMSRLREETTTGEPESFKTAIDVNESVIDKITAANDEVLEKLGKK